MVWVSPEFFMRALDFVQAERSLGLRFYWKRAVVNYSEAENIFSSWEGQPERHFDITVDVTWTTCQEKLTTVLPLILGCDFR